MASGTPPVNTRQIAALAGVHHSTVSLALRHHPRIPESTRARIADIARRLGYRLDPRVRELMQHLRQHRAGRYVETLAYVTHETCGPLFRPAGLAISQLQGVRAQAEVLGYRVDEFRLERDGLTAKRLDEILLSRGIRGIVVGPQAQRQPIPPLRWERYETVVLNQEWPTFPAHRVMAQHVSILVDALTAAHARGYRRPGLILSAAQDDRMQHLWHIAYRGFCDLHRDITPLPACMADSEDTAHRPREQRRLLAWFERHRPDVILTTAMEWLGVLREHGYRCPREFGFVSLDKHNYRGYERCTGIDQQHGVIGAIAVNQLAGYLAQGKTGRPAIPTTVMVPGLWREGDTLRATPASALSRRDATPKPRAKRPVNRRPAK